MSIIIISSSSSSIIIILILILITISSSSSSSTYSLDPRGPKSRPSGSRRQQSQSILPM